MRFFKELLKTSKVLLTCSVHQMILIPLSNVTKFFASASLLVASHGPIIHPGDLENLIPVAGSLCQW